MQSQAVAGELLERVVAEVARSAQKVGAQLARTATQRVHRRPKEDSTQMDWVVCF